MAKKKYGVELTAEERTTLEQLRQKGKSSARKLPRARILLQADEGLTDEEIATALAVGGLRWSAPASALWQQTWRRSTHDRVRVASASSVGSKKPL
jgi:hypothetical protein